MIPRFPVYIFDVDGTLLDSILDITGAVREVLDAEGRGDVSFEYLKSFIGRHLHDLWIEVFPGITQERSDELLAHYRRIYLAREHASTRVFPGVSEALAALPGRKTTATTKGSPTTRAVLEKFGLLHHFEHVQGTDGFAAKPEPDVIHRAMAALGAKPEDCLMVGDAPADMEAGRRAGIKTCAVRYGYGDPAQLAALQPDFWIDTLADL